MHLLASSMASTYFSIIWTYKFEIWDWHYHKKMNGMVFLAWSGWECITLGILDGWAMPLSIHISPKRETSDLRIHVQIYLVNRVQKPVIRGEFRNFCGSWVCREGVRRSRTESPVHPQAHPRQNHNNMRSPHTWRHYTHPSHALPTLQITLTGSPLIIDSHVVIPVCFFTIIFILKLL